MSKPADPMRSASGGGPPPTPASPEEPGDKPAGILPKIVLTVFPFLLLAILLVVEMWIRGRS